MFDHAIEYDLHDLAQASYSYFGAADAREFVARANVARATLH
jgi:hypothetical protein